MREKISAMHTARWTLAKSPPGTTVGGLVVDAALEASGAPVDEPLGLDGGNGCVHVLGDVTAEHHAAGHIFAVAGVALGHHGGGLEDGVGDFRDGQLVISLLGRDDGGVRGENEMDTRVRHQVGLELGDIDAQSTI
jgi:hypothetical protein